MTIYHSTHFVGAPAITGPVYSPDNKVATVTLTTDNTRVVLSIRQAELQAFRDILAGIATALTTIIEREELS